MKRAGPVLVAAGALAALSASLPAGPGDEAAAQKSASAGLCAADETMLFQCRMGNRIAALCGRRTPTRQVRYLSGRPGQIDYASPADARFRWRPDEGPMTVRFRDGEDEYTIYRDRGSRLAADGRYEDEAIDGVRVMRGERLVSHRRCAGEARTGGPFQDYMDEGELE